MIESISMENCYCNFDGEDCYCKYDQVENGICNLVYNKPVCDYDGGDCCDSSMFGDSLCYQVNNNPNCDSDGGDCCQEIQFYHKPCTGAL